MDRLRAKLDEIVEQVKDAVNGEPMSPVEILLNEHLEIDSEVAFQLMNMNCTAVGMPTSVMNDFASRTRNIVDYPCIMERIWEILIDHQHNPNLMKKVGQREIIKARTNHLLYLGSQSTPLSLDQRLNSSV